MRDKAGGGAVLMLHVAADASSALPQQPGPPVADAMIVLEDEGAPEQHVLSFDDALVKYVGQFGRGQALNYLLGCLFNIANAALILLLVFSLGSPVADKAWACSSGSSSGGGGADESACAALQANPDPLAVQAGFCSLAPGTWQWVRPSEKLASQFGFVCTRSWMAQAANSLFFVGYLIGSGVFGLVADAYGRKATACGASALAAVLTVAALGARSAGALLALRLLTGIGVAGQALGSYLLATENLGPAWRGVAGIMFQVAFIVGELVLVVFAVAFHGWRGQFAAAAVLCGATLLLWPLLPESARWLHVRGRRQEAVQILTWLADVNGSKAPREPLQHIAGPGSCQTGGADTGDNAKPPSLRVLLSNWHVARRFFILAYSWMAMCMAYYGISFALGSLGGSLLVSFTIGALAELPSYVVAAWAIEHIGRHNTMAGGLLLGGAACIGCAVTPAGAGRTVLAALGKFGIAGSFGIAFIFTSELFPTQVRSAVLGYENQAARVGGIMAPFIVMAGSASGGGGSNLVPFLTFGATSMLAGLLIFTLPETLGVPLPDTMQDMDNIASVFTHKTWRTRGMLAATRSMFKLRDVPQQRPAPAAAPPAAKQQAPLLATVSESGSSTSGACVLSAGTSKASLLGGHSRSKEPLLQAAGGPQGSSSAQGSAAAAAAAMPASSDDCAAMEMGLHTSSRRCDDDGGGGVCVSMRASACVR